MGRYGEYLYNEYVHTGTWVGYSYLKYLNIFEDKPYRNIFLHY